MKPIPLKAQLAGRFKLTMTSVSDGRVRETDWFDNIVTDSGLNGIGTNNMIDACYVGTGSTTPSASNTALVSFLASTTVVIGDVRGASVSSPYYGKTVRTYRFGAGVAAGNVSEIGIAPMGSVPQPLFSRALVLDGGGSPTTITVLSDEILDVTYEIRAYYPEDDWTDTVTIDGDSYDITLRAANVTSVMSPGGPGFQVVASGTSVRCYTGAIGAVTANPSGTLIDQATGVADTYSNNSYQRQFHWTFSVDTAGDVKSVLWSTSYGDYQMEFDPPIPKLSTQTLYMKTQLAWARKDL